MAIPFYYNPATNELELTADPSPLRDSLGTRFRLNEISTARETLSPIKSYTEGGRIGFEDGTTLEEIKKATEKKYKDFVKAFKKKNKRNPSMSEIKAQIKGGGDWATMRKYLVEGEDFLTKSETLKMVQPAKVLIEDMPKGMDAWLTKEKIEVEWRSINNQARAKLKLRFANRNNPYFKGLEQRKIFEDYIEGLIKKGETGAWDKNIEDLVKESKAEIEKGVAQDVILDKKFAVKGSVAEKLFPKLEARAIELLNEGLSAPEVTTTLEDEGIIKVKKRWDKSKGLFTRDTKLFTNFYRELLKEGKIKTISETISGTQIPIAERTKIDKAVLDYMKKNPDIDSSNQIAKAVSSEVNRNINKGWVENAIRRSGQEPDKFFQTSSKKIFSDVKALDKLIKNNQKLLDSDISFAEKNRILIGRYAEATGKPFKIAAGEFVTRLRKLGNLYSEQPQRFEKALYNTIKAPANYVGSLFHKNFVALADASGRLSVVDKAKLLKLPQNEIKLLSELSTAARELAGFSMAGDHTDIDSLMKNFANYRKNFTGIEWVRESLNRFKQLYDDKILTLYRAAKRGQTTVMVDGEQVPIKDRIKFWQTEFKNKTGYRIGDFKIDAKGNTYIEPTALRIPDIKNPINTVLKQTLQGLATYKVPKTVTHSAQKPIEITNAFDKAMTMVKTVKERIEVFKKWQGKPELLNSRLIKALGAIPRLKSFVKLLTAGTMTSAALITLATAGTTLEKGITTEEMKKRKEEIEPGDEKLEAGVSGDVAKGLTYGTLGTIAANYPKEILEGGKKALKWTGEKLTPLLAPGVSHAFKLLQGEPYKPTSGHDMTTMAFWKGVINTMGKTSKLGDTTIPLKKRLKDLAWRGGIPTRFLPLISGGASLAAGPMLVNDFAKWLQSNIDKEGITGLIEEQSGYDDPMSAGASVLMEDVIEEKKRKDAEGMDYAQGGIASLLK